MFLENLGHSHTEISYLVYLKILEREILVFKRLEDVSPLSYMWFDDIIYYAFA